MASLYPKTRTWSKWLAGGNKLQWPSNDVAVGSGTGAATALSLPGDSYREKTSSKYVLHHTTVHIRQPEVPPAVTIS